ncbi:MAG: hypothetical protein IKL89_04340 [Clostridia bacterium]|nr:hypothetical protein [Clostridia bacterium]
MNSMPMPQDTHYFFGANTAEGFASFRDDYLPPAERRRVCILKGGPGTGKSGLMRRVAEYAGAAGIPCAYYHCASDPESLDAVVFPTRGTAVVDGTAPHVVEAECPGAVEDYISFSPYWDSAAIGRRREEIEAVGGRMRSEFAAAGRYLSAAAALAANTLECALGGTSREALHRRGRALARRYIPAERRGGGRVMRTFLGAVTPEGRRFFDHTVTGLCERVVVLEDRLGLAPFVLAPVLSAARGAGLLAIAGHCPLNPKKLEHILLPELGVAFVSATPDHPMAAAGTRGVRTDHIPDKEYLSAHQSRLREDERRAARLVDSAVEALARAKTHHDRLEACYTPYMNFAGIDRLAEAVSEKVLG